jgi:hypothetical protein
MSFGFKEQQTLKYPNAMFCSISIQEPGVKVDGGSNNNFTITQACINAMRIASTPFAPYDFSLGKCYAALQGRSRSSLNEFALLPPAFL